MPLLNCMQNDLVGSLNKSGVFDIITDRAYSKRLISQDVKDKITSSTSCKTETERTRILLDAIQDKISKNADVYHQFIEILQEDETCKDVACILETKLHAHRKEKGGCYILQLYRFN